MNDYIKREDALNALREYPVTKLKTAIRRLPSADVAPVRYGLWYADEDSRIVCSECKHGAPYMYKISDKLVMQELTDYCPNCGARMDGGDDEID